MSTIAIFEDLQAIPRKTLQKISTPSFTVTLEAKIKYEQVDTKVDFQEIIKESHFDKDDVDESVEKAVEDPTPKLVHEISSHQHIHFIVADKFMEAISKREIYFCLLRTHSFRGFKLYLIFRVQFVVQEFSHILNWRMSFLKAERMMWMKSSY